VPEVVTPNEIAEQLGVTGLAFRNWLRAQNAAGHPLVASHEYRTHYRFTRGEADQLAAEFTEQVPGGSSTSDRAAGGPTRSPRKVSTSRASQVEPPPSDDPGHRVTVEWMGESVATLADLLRPALRAVAVGINPAPKSVAAGHYYQGNYGQTFFRRLRMAGVLPDGLGYEDDRSFAAGTGFTDVVKRPTPSKHGLRPGELQHGRAILEPKLRALNIPLVIFVFKSAAEALLGPLPPHAFGLVPRKRLGEARIFVMPGPTAASAIESDAIRKLKRAMRAAS
jgi:TDG/mug DNA glycosylase family protein